MREKQSLLTDEAAAELHALQEPPPCLSLYQPAHRRHPENQQDPIRFRNLVEELEASLRREYPTAAADQMLEPFHALAADAEFWNHTADGLAVLSSRGFFRVFTLQRPVEELAIVADSFHTKPLRRYLQSVDRYHVLGRLTALGAAFKEARAKGLGSDDLEQVAEAAAAGRVATLLIEADRQIAGRLDGATGKIERKELSNPQVDDLLDDLAEWVGKTSGLVRVLPAEWMPAQTCVAATYRY